MVGVVAACSSNSSRIDQLASELKYIESNMGKISEGDWERVGQLIADLSEDVFANRQKYNQEQLKKVGELQGKYTALVMKSGLEDFQKTMKDFESQLEGFLEGFDMDNLN
jgi:hypothetical protein